MRLIEVAQRASAERVLEGTWRGRPYRYPEWVVLLQAAYHATAHRQQIATALSQMGFTPPEPDVWTYWDSIRSAQSRP